MAPSGGIWAPLALRVMKHAFKKTSELVKLRLAKLSKPLEQDLRTVLVRNSPAHPIHRVARLRQGKGRWYTTHSTINAAVRRFMSTTTGNAGRYDRASLPASMTAAAIARSSIRAPFASTLRPNLTGGTLTRTAGGYGLGGGAGGARYFSHSPAAPAQVVHNVSAACRAFWLSGQKAEFNGMSTQGEKCFRSVTALQDKTRRAMQSVPRATPGAFIDFQLTPTILSLSRLGSGSSAKLSSDQKDTTLNTEGLLDVLSVDFARVLKDLAVVMGDLKRLSQLGDLPITLEADSVLRIRFPGCDAESVERLCNETGVQRGIVHQDHDFLNSVGGKVALMFPFAPDNEVVLSSPGGSLRSQTGLDQEEPDEFENPWLEGYESMEESNEMSHTEPSQLPSQLHSSSEFEGVEGIYRFIEQCDQARRF